MNILTDVNSLHWQSGLIIMYKPTVLTHWGRVTHICVSKLTIIGSDNGLSPGRRQVIIWTNDGILLIGPLGTIFSEILIEIYMFSFKKIHLKTSSGNWQPFCLGLLDKIIQGNAMWLLNPNRCTWPLTRLLQYFILFSGNVLWRCLHHFLISFPWTFSRSVLWRWTFY